jgi:hypothetical protein
VPAVVVSNTPTYSYGPGIAEATATDQVQLEAILLRHRVSAVISGRLGWNARYWATAPGLHEPCPGGGYRDTPPQTQTPSCAPGGGGDTAGAPPASADGVATALRGLGAPRLPETSGVTGIAGGLLPFVVASGAGGKFGPNGEQQEGSASDGYWHGYSVVRVPADGDPRGVIVEQRPILDWIGLTAQTQVVRPGQRLKLRGVGREPIGQRRWENAPMTRFNTIDSPAITHRYDLLEADENKPSQLPKVVEGNGNPHGYVPLDPTVAAIDSQTGQVQAGRGNHAGVRAIAVLSVADKAATWPLTFTSRRSFVARKPSILTAPTVAQVRTVAIAGQSLPTPPSGAPPAVPPPVSATLALPTPPAIPTFPTASPPLSSPAVPPAPPAPPGGTPQANVNLTIDVAGIAVPTTPGVTAQPTPPVNPAPPGGARKEARQKQAATAKSEEGGAGDQASDATGSLGTEPPGAHGAAFTRHDRVKAAPAGFTPLRRTSQPSAWATGLQWGGGTVLMALVLAFGWITVRPTPRGRPPVLPAHAWARRGRRG